MSGMREDSVDFEEAQVPGSMGVIGTRGVVTLASNIPEKIIKKLARIAGLEYGESHRNGGGGLCLGIEGVRQRRRALEILGRMVGQIGKSSTDNAVESSGATWLDVVGWREDVEYAALWTAAVKVRREVAAARLEDELWDRSLNGVMIDEPKKDGEGKLSVTKVKKYDNGLGVQLLKGLGFVGKDAGARSAKGVGRGEPADRPVPGVDGEPEHIGPNVDTVLFADRKTAFDAMGRPAGPAGKGG